MFLRRLFFHQSLPLEVAEDGDDDVEAVEAGLEGNVLVEIEHAGDDIDGNPDEPLLQVFVRQCPDADEAEGGGEAVGHGYVAVGERHKQPVDDAPDGSHEHKPGQHQSAGKVTDGQGLLRLAAPDPSPVAVDGHREVVELHGTVGVKALLIVEHDAERLHEEADKPHPQAGLIFQQDIGQAEDGGEDVEPMSSQKIHIKFRISA